MNCYHCLVLLAVALSACSPEPPPTPPLALLAHDVHFSIAKQTIRLPLVAISQTGHLCSEKGKIPCNISLEKINANESITVNVLQVSLENYSGYPDYRTESIIDIPELCPMLSQEWARRVCQTNGMDFLGLQRFTLVKEDYIDSFHNEWLDNGNTGEMVQKMSLDGETPSAGCD